MVQTEPIPNSNWTEPRWTTQSLWTINRVRMMPSVMLKLFSLSGWCYFCCFCSFCIFVVIADGFSFVIYLIVLPFPCFFSFFCFIFGLLPLHSLPHPLPIHLSYACTHSLSLSLLQLFLAFLLHLFLFVFVVFFFCVFVSINGNLRCGFSPNEIGQSAFVNKRNETNTHANK